MTPDQIELLRRLALNDRDAVIDVMSEAWRDDTSLDPKTESLVRIVTLLSIDSDSATLQWALDLGLATGLGDDDVFDALLVVAPIIGVGRLSSMVPHLLEALGIGLVEG